MCQFFIGISCLRICYLSFVFLPKILNNSSVKIKPVVELELLSELSKHEKNIFNMKKIFSLPI